MDKWQLPHGKNSPDFIISGAMKSGTSTIHGILAKHPDVYIPEQELHFFDHDNIVEHPNFQYFNQKSKVWCSNTSAENYSDYLAWYYQQFENARSDVLIGEDSTTYLASPTALKRIASQNKPCKVIVMLRHPSARAYSQYWHELRAGRAIYSFEDTLQFNPNSILSRSQYLTQLRVLFQYLPRTQVKVVIFEEFIKNKRKVINNLCDFLGIDAAIITDQDLELHENAAKLPRSIKLQLLKNSLFRQAGNIGYTHHYNQKLGKAKSTKLSANRVINKVHSVINPLIHKATPVMNTNTKSMLDRYFKEELAELDDVVGHQVLAHWF